MNLLLERCDGRMRLKHGDAAQVGNRKIKLDDTAGPVESNFGTGPGFRHYSTKNLKHTLVLEIGEMSRVGIPFPTRFVVNFDKGEANPGPWNMHDAVDLREMLEVHGVFREFDDVHAHFAAVVPPPVNKLPAIYLGLFGKAVKNPVRRVLGVVNHNHAVIVHRFPMRMDLGWQFVVGGNAADLSASVNPPAVKGTSQLVSDDLPMGQIGPHVRAKGVDCVNLSV